MREICHIQTGQCGNQIVCLLFPLVPSWLWADIGVFRVPRFGMSNLPLFQRATASAFLTRLCRQIISGEHGLDGAGV